MAKGTKPKPKRRKRRRPRLADGANRHQLYQLSVQNPEFDIRFFSTVYREKRRRKPRVLREDFCGTALLATEWVKSHPKRTALGIDLDEPTLAFGREHVVGVEPAGVQDRIQLLRADVLDVIEPKADVTCALNFSFCVFKTREQLRRYFDVARQGLAADGVFIVELYGGTEAITEVEDEREVEDFTYIWQQAKYNPITHDTICHIHFEFSDGSRLDRAFTYDWRLWTIPEVRECMSDVGFRSAEVYWEQVDKRGEGTGRYLPTIDEENQETWIVYIVATV